MRPLISAAAVSLALAAAPVSANPDVACDSVVASVSAGPGAPAPIAPELPLAAPTAPDFDQAIAASKCAALVAGTPSANTASVQAPAMAATTTIVPAPPAATATATVAMPVPGATAVGTGAAAPAASTASAIVPAVPGMPATTPPPPGQAVVDPASYQPKTEFDNTPWRFNMEQNGKRMTADEFTAWMEARGVRVARGAARPVSAQNPTGDGRPPNWSSATAGEVGTTETVTVPVQPAPASPPANAAPSAVGVPTTTTAVAPTTTAISATGGTIAPTASTTVVVPVAEPVESVGPAPSETREARDEEGDEDAAAPTPPR